MINSFDDLLKVVHSFRPVRVLFTAVELDLFDYLHNAKTLEELTKLTEANKRALERLLYALIVMNLVKKDGDHFSNTSIADRYLNSNSPEYMHNIKHQTYLWINWSTMTAAVKQGSKTLPDIADSHIGRRQAFIDAMHAGSSSNADNIVAALDLKHINSMLDLGGGSGDYAMAFKRKLPQAKVTIMDMPTILPITKQYLIKNNMDNAIDLIPGDFMVDDIGSGYDLVLMSNIIHIFTPALNQMLSSKVFGSLNSKGQVVIQDFIMDEDRLKPAHGVFFALNMLVATSTGDTYTEAEIKTWLNTAGFKNVQRCKTSSELIIGHKL